MHSERIHHFCISLKVVIFGFSLHLQLLLILLSGLHYDSRSHALERLALLEGFAYHTDLLIDF